MPRNDQRQAAGSGPRSGHEAAGRNDWLRLAVAKARGRGRPERVTRPIARYDRRMRISEFLLSEFDVEMANTRTALERVPAAPDFAPHPKSMPLGRLAPHVAELGGFGLSVLTTPAVDFSQGTYKPLPFESAAQLVRVFDERTAKVRDALASLEDSAWLEPWKLSFGGTTIFEGTRFLAYREMFLNHLVHHRAQLGVYLRLQNTPVPATYGPSADETLGF
jgi:uncharacterized damage-inducible protein DinB